MFTKLASVTDSALTGVGKVTTEEDFKIPTDEARKAVRTATQHRLGGLN